MGKSENITLEDAKKLDEQIEKEYPNKKPVALGQILKAIAKKPTSKGKKNKEER